MFGARDKGASALAITKRRDSFECPWLAFQIGEDNSHAYAGVAFNYWQTAVSEIDCGRDFRGHGRLLGVGPAGLALRSESNEHPQVRCRLARLGTGGGPFKSGRLFA